MSEFWKEYQKITAYKNILTPDLLCGNIDIAVQKYVPTSTTMMVDNCIWFHGGNLDELFVQKPDNKSLTIPAYRYPTVIPIYPGHEFAFLIVEMSDVQNQLIKDRVIIKEIEDKKCSTENQRYSTENQRYSTDKQFGLIVYVQNYHTADQKLVESCVTAAVSSHVIDQYVLHIDYVSMNNKPKSALSIKQIFPAVAKRLGFKPVFSTGEQLVYDFQL